MSCKNEKIKLNFHQCRGTCSTEEEPEITVQVLVEKLITPPIEGVPPTMKTRPRRWRLDNDLLASI